MALKEMYGSKSGLLKNYGPKSGLLMDLNQG